MISAGDFRNGVTFDMDGKVVQVIEFQHVKPGKGAAFVRTKIRNVISGAVTEVTSALPTSIPPLMWKEKTCSIFITTETCIILWTTKPMKIFPLTKIL